MLYMVGLGVWDENDISLKGVAACKKSSEIYIELYTAAWGGNVRHLENLIGKKIRILRRSDIEEGSDELVEKARHTDIALLVPGDPLVATTHTQLVLSARKKGVPVCVIHSSSVYTAIAKTGLQIYKFGRVSTIPKHTMNYAPESFFDVIEENLSHGLHTLLLLDVDMGTREAIEILETIDAKKGKDILKDRKILICSRLGSQEEKIAYGSADELKHLSFPAPSVVVIPGNLHFMEEEFLKTLEVTESL